MAERSGITHRYSVLAPAQDPGGGAVDDGGFYTRGAFPSSATRMALYERTALPLALDAVASLKRTNDLGTISHLIVTSCTGFYAPGLDMQLAAVLGLRPDVERTMVGFMGCYAAFNALKLARHIVRSEPESRVLLVNLELCTLHLQETQDLERVLSFLVFADGCAASLVSAEPEGLALDHFHAALVPESEGLITWRIGDLGFDMHLSGQVPAALAEGPDSGRADDPRRGQTGGYGVVGRPSRWSVGYWMRSVALSPLPAAALDISRGVLRDFGNMSSATILFVLERMMRAVAPGQRGCAMAFGPGLMAETMLFRTV